MRAVATTTAPREQSDEACSEPGQHGDIEEELEAKEDVLCQDTRDEGDVLLHVVPVRVLDVAGLLDELLEQGERERGQHEDDVAQRYGHEGHLQAVMRLRVEQVPRLPRSQLVVTAVAPPRDVHRHDAGARGDDKLGKDVVEQQVDDGEDILDEHLADVVAVARERARDDAHAVVVDLDEFVRPEVVHVDAHEHDRGEQHRGACACQRARGGDACGPRGRRRALDGHGDHEPLGRVQREVEDERVDLTDDV